MGASDADSGVIDPAAIAMLASLDEGADTDTVAELASIFLLSTRARLARVTGAMAELNLVLVAAEAHAIKSAAGQLGARELQRLSAELEACAKRGEGARARELLPQLAFALEVAREALEALRPGIQTSSD